MTEQILPQTLSDFQADLINEVLYGTARVILLPGSRYGGKTFASILGQMLHGMQYERPRMLLGGTAYSDIRANCSEALEYWTDALGLRYRWPRGGTEIEVGSQIWEVRGLLHEDGARRVKGRGYKGAYIDELSEVHAQNWHMVFTSVRGPGVKIIASWNPKGPRHFTELMARNPETYNATVLHSTMLDNVYADPDSVAAFQNRDAYPDFQYQRLVLGLPANPEGQVYPYWDETDAGPQPTPCYAGIDYGESNVTAAVYAQRRPGTDDTHFMAVTAEYYYHGQRQGRRDAVEHARQIVNYAPGPIAAAYIDPTAVDLRDALARAGVPVYNAYNDVSPGIDICNGALQSGKLRINAGLCPALVTEIDDLVYNKNMGKPDPACSDHATDALRYLACGISAVMSATVSREVRTRG